MYIRWFRPDLKIKALIDLALFFLRFNGSFMANFADPLGKRCRRGSL